MNLYKNGAYYYIQFKYNDKWFARSLKVKTKAEARKKINQLGVVNLADYFGLVRQCEDKLSYLIDEYLMYSEVNKADRTNREDVQVTNRFLDFTGNMYITDVQPVQIQNYINFRKATSGIGKSRTRIELSVIRAMFNYGRRIGLVHHYPFDVIKVGGSGRRLEYMDKEQIDKFLNVSDNPDERDYFTILIMTGWRYGEFYSLPNENINSDHVILNGKQGKRIYPLVEKVYKKILPYDLKNRIQKLKEKGGYYFFNKHQIHPSIGYMSRKFKQYAKNAGLPENYVLYTLRHTFATQLLLAGVNILAVSKLMGHSSLKTTQIYEHVDINNIEMLL